MSQIFHPSTNIISKLSILGALLVLAVVILVLAEIFRSPYATGAHMAIEQPLQFSHEHHVGDDGIDCRYCHTSVEASSFAGIPSTEICMNCHSQIFADAPYLEPVRESWRTGKPLRWRRVHDLPDFVYFDHSIHVQKGIGCVICHGRVDKMPLIWQVRSLHMDWCLECHRRPEKYLMPRDKVFSMDWQPPPDQIEMGLKLVKEYNIPGPELLTSCSICHR